MRVGVVPLWVERLRGDQACDGWTSTVDVKLCLCLPVRERERDGRAEELQIDLGHAFNVLFTRVIPLLFRQRRR